jgi:6-pyruvoyltetrahydropterin/6-carboxytetrahydropterin synthase
MTETYSIRLTKDYFVFSAAHFITYDGATCERLHGHNYRVFAELHGPTDENHYVVDFIALRDLLQGILQPLDHHMLLPDRHPLIRVRPSEREIEVTFADRRWVFPRGDCIVLPMPNTTAEMLARYIGLQLLEHLRARSLPDPRQLHIGVDENNGQWGIWQWNRSEADPSAAASTTP